MFEWIMNGGQLAPGFELGYGWHELPQSGTVPSERYGHSLSALGTQLYLLGGFAESETFDQFQQYTPATQHWIGQSAPGARRYHTTDVLGGSLYLVGGASGSSASTAVNTVQRYGPDTASWVTRAGMPAARFGHASTVHNGLLYVHAGRSSSSGGSAVNTLYRYDPSTNTWLHRATGGLAGANHRLVAQGEFLYQLATNGVFWRYSVTGNSWSQLPNPPTGARAGCSFVAYGGYLWVWGGLLSTANSNDLWRHDPATGVWTEVVVDSPLPPGRRYHATALWGSRLVVHGGYSGSYRNDLWLLDLATL